MDGCLYMSTRALRATPSALSVVEDSIAGVEGGSPGFLGGVGGVCGERVNYFCVSLVCAVHTVTTERKGRPTAWKSYGEARGLFGPYCHHG